MKKTPVIIASLIILGGWGISMTRFLSSSSKSADGSANGSADSAKSDPADRSAGSKPYPDSAVIAARIPASVPAANSPAPARVEVSPIKFQFQEELNSYAQLKTKVLPSPKEQAAKSALLKNASFLRSLSDRLTKVPMLSIGEQDAALDLLVDALKNGDQATAEGAIADVIADKQVEDTKVAAPVREQMAGIKAELLYHWTAVQPDQASQVGRLLPGPVSQRIWNNVRAAQSNNLAESESEK